MSSELRLNPGHRYETPYTPNTTSSFRADRENVFLMIPVREKCIRDRCIEIETLDIVYLFQMETDRG